jgi:bifunctional DNA-binding transcriptional regulator/antitoxin component of YhaV-PrlF toxin-antitoxin module
MKQITATITQQSQVTVPAEVLRALGLKPKDKVAFTIASGEVRLAAASASFSLESAYGSVKPSSHPEDFEKIARIAKDVKAESTARQLDNL